MHSSYEYKMVCLSEVFSTSQQNQIYLPNSLGIEIGYNLDI